MKVLVVDDDPSIAEFAAIALREHGHEVQIAHDGKAGLDAAAAFRPDLVVLDLMMPRMHGFEVCQRLRADASMKGLKVLITSSKSYSTDIDAAMAAGADAYLVKPYSAQDLIKRAASLGGQASTAVSVRFWGTRGSLPTPGKDTIRYGGNTSCTEVRVGDLILILDSGTGIRELGEALSAEFRDKPIEAHLFIGHTHWDHIQGFPFFTPIYAAKNHLTVYSVRGAGKSLEKVFRGQMDSDYFPVPLPKLACQLKFVELDGPIELRGANVAYQYLNHPGVAIGFRIEAAGRVVTYLSDHEAFGRLAPPSDLTKRQDEAIVEFARGSDLLICEAQYTEEEYKAKKGWGHSTFDDVVQRAAAAGVKQLALFHHDPAHSDDEMDRQVARCRQMLSGVGSPIQCFAAQEGQSVEL